MHPIEYSLLIHFIGFGMVFTTILAGWVLIGQYRKAGDWHAKVLILRAARAVGLLSPLGTLVLLLSGIANMAFGGYTLFSTGWLSSKLMIFVLLVVIGTFAGIRGGRRAKLAAALAQGTAPHGSEQTLLALNRQQRTFFLLQIVLILVILWLSIVKPLA